MVNTKIRLITFSAAKDGEALYSQQKQDQELNVAQIMNSLLPYQTQIEESREKANRVLPREHNGHSKYPLPTTQEKTTHEHHPMVNTIIRLIILFAAKDGVALYSQQKQDQELTVAQIMNSLLPNSDLN